MTNTAAAKTPSTISTNAAWAAMGATLTYQVLLGALIFLRPDLDPSWHSISEWAIGPHRWIMSCAFLVSSVSYACLFVMLRTELGKPMGRIGLGILLICAIGAAGAGIFTTDPMPFRPPLSTRGTLHVICGTIQLVLFPFAALLIGLSLARANQIWARACRLLIWSAWLPLFGFVGFAAYTSLFVVPMGPRAYGPGVNIGWPPRFAFFTYMLWILIVGSQAIKCCHLRSEQGHLHDELRDYLPSAKALIATTMSKIDFQSVDEYISSKPEAVAATLELVRSAILRALPKAEEVISYKMPAYKQHGEVILYFAGWKHHYSLYPAGLHLMAAFKDELATYEVEKGTIRFPLSAPVPKKLIADVAKFRLGEVADRKKTSAITREKTRHALLIE